MRMKKIKKNEYMYLKSNCELNCRTWLLCCCCFSIINDEENKIITQQQRQLRINFVSSLERFGSVWMRWMFLCLFLYFFLSFFLLPFESQRVCFFSLSSFFLCCISNVCTTLTHDRSLCFQLWFELLQRINGLTVVAVVVQFLCIHREWIYSVLNSKSSNSTHTHTFWKQFSFGLLCIPFYYYYFYKVFCLKFEAKDFVSIRRYNSGFCLNENLGFSFNSAKIK